MWSLRTSLVAALATGASASLYGESPYNHTCEIQADRNFLSCSAQASQKNVDSCCVETFGGLVLQTQFWSTYTGLESQGQLLPPNTWTIHGLWPDFCNGSYTQYCDLNRQYDPQPSPNTTNGKPGGTPVPPYKGPSVATFIEAFGRYDLLEYMNTYWIAQNQPNPDFWGHEQSKHQTCYSTFDVPCYGPKYVEHEDIIDFYDTVVKYWQRLPTFDFLKKHGVTPSNTTTYSLSDFETALTQEHGGQTPYVGCSGARYNETAAGKGSSDNGRTAISEVWYYYHVHGRPQDGNAVPTAQTGASNCAKTKGALHYYETTKSSVRQGTYPPSGQYSPSGPPTPPSPPSPPTPPSPPSPPTPPSPPSPPYGPPSPPKYGPPAPPHYI